MHSINTSFYFIAYYTVLRDSNRATTNNPNHSLTVFHYLSRNKMHLSICSVLIIFIIQILYLYYLKQFIYFIIFVLFTCCWKWYSTPLLLTVPTINVPSHEYFTVQSNMERVRREPVFYRHTLSNGFTLAGSFPTSLGRTYA